MKSAVFLLLVGIAACAAYVRYEEPAPNTPNGTCISELVGEMIFGEKKSVPGVCEEAECLDNGLVYFAGCNWVDFPPECKDDKNREYPNCCPEHIC